MVASLLQNGVGAVGAMFERVLGAGFDAPDPLTTPSFGPPVGVNPQPFGSAQIQMGPVSFGDGIQVSSNPFDRGGVQLESDPFGSGGIPLSANPFGSGPQISSNPFQAPYTPPPAAPVSPTGSRPGGPGGAAGWAGPATSDDNKTLTAGAVEAYIAQAAPNSPLRGMGQFILDTANQLGVSVPQALGIMRLESRLGSDGSYLPSVFNFGGLTGKGWQGQTGSTTGMARDFATFATKEDGVRAILQNLASDLYRGKSLQQQIGLWYLGDENAGLGTSDEQGNATMQQYLDVVAGVYQALGIPLNPTQAPTPTGGGSPIANPSALEQAAQPLLGNPYQLGGRRANGRVGPGIGIDCSEFTAYLYEQQGIKLTWNAAAQAQATQRVERGQWQPGDLIFFQGTYDTGRGEVVTHVGMFVGYDANGRPMMLHSGSNGVEYADLSSKYYQDHYWGAGRVTR